MRKLCLNEALISTADTPAVSGVAQETELVYEDVPDEDVLPAGWEDVLWETYQERQLEKERAVGEGLVPPSDEERQEIGGERK